MPNQFTAKPSRPVLCPIGPSIAYICLTQGKFALIDADDVIYLSLTNMEWIAVHHRNTCYAVAGTTGGSNVRMHRFIVRAPRGVQVDHANGNGLDNRRQNLRFCSNSQNQQNCRKIRSSSGYKGVYFDKQKNRWCAGIGKERIGRFSSPEEAARAYDAEVIKRFGEFAATNKMLVPNFT